MAIEQRDDYDVSSVTGWKIIHPPQECGDAFGLYQEGEVKTGQLPPKYGSGTLFSA